MGRKPILAVAAAAALAAAAFWLYRVTAPPPAPRTVVMRLGDFAWRDMENRPHRLAEFGGRPLLIHFWASWCAPCAAEFPALLAYANGPAAPVVLAISSDGDRGQARAFIDAMERKVGIVGHDRVLYAFDPDRTLTYDVFQTALYPETVVLDPDHRLRKKYGGVVAWGDDGVRTEIAAITGARAQKH